MKLSSLHFLRLSVCIAALLVCGAFTAVAQPHRYHFDPKHPAVHDPVMALGEDGRYYIFSTGMGISVMTVMGSDTVCMMGRMLAFTSATVSAKIRMPI